MTAIIPLVLLVVGQATAPPLPVAPDPPAPPVTAMAPPAPVPLPAPPMRDAAPPAAQAEPQVPLPPIEIELAGAVLRIAPGTEAALTTVLRAVRASVL